MTMHPISRNLRPARSPEKSGPGSAAGGPESTAASFARIDLASIISKYIGRLEEELSELRAIKAVIKHDPDRQADKAMIDRHIDEVTAAQTLARSAALEPLMRSNPSFARGETLRDQIKIVRHDVEDRGDGFEQTKATLENMAKLIERLNNKQGD